jgi:hypothetical protein
VKIGFPSFSSGSAFGWMVAAKFESEILSRKSGMTDLIN